MSTKTLKIISTILVCAFLLFLFHANRGIKFTKNFEQAFCSKRQPYERMPYIDGLFRDGVVFEYRTKELLYYKTRDHINDYFKAGNHLIDGTISATGLTKKEDSTMYFYIIAEGLYNTPNQDKSELSMRVSMEGTYVIHVQSESPLFGYIFFGIPMR